MKIYQFAPTRPILTTVLLLTLAPISNVNSNQHYKDAFYEYLGPGYSYVHLQSSSNGKTASTTSVLGCAAIGLNSDSPFFSYNKVSKLCTVYSPNNILSLNFVQNSNERSYYNKNSEWVKVYSISMGAGSKVYNSFLNIGSPSTWNVDKCNGAFCPNFFRHPILDIWSHLPVDDVKLVLYKNKTVVVTVVFDGRNSTITNWFSHENLKSSPWNDLTAVKPSYFSVTGDRFYLQS
ncbi:uncharacterized protein LOC106873261 [Octopus bimaculoides]|uniref:uncharacterized protein LOC106873261 n=1 Tax=Octopus bimaculoides TaxID=37653 RepID=UPI00071D9957|nr:uncharacterized protein LOC106873261 [Octopus bimaculoides]|eukprot:XP_014776039.1 PREDICTED: uncharacterized protein LOC106873261 [Octopus bimaculoides]